MKVIKRKMLIILIITVMLSITLFNVISYAADPIYTLSINGSDSGSGNIGQTVTVDVSFLDGIEDVYNFSVYIAYDPSLLKIIPDEVTGEGPTLKPGYSLKNEIGASISIRNYI